MLYDMGWYDTSDPREGGRAGMSVDGRGGEGWGWGWGAAGLERTGEAEGSWGHGMERMCEKTETVVSGLLRSEGASRSTESQCSALLHQLSDCCSGSKR